MKICLYQSVLSVPPNGVLTWFDYPRIGSKGYKYVIFGVKTMPISIRTAFLLFCVLLIGACARTAEKPPQTEQEMPGAEYYTWSSFFSDGCGRSMIVVVRDDDSGTLIYNCPSGETKMQYLKRHPAQGAVQVWVAERLAGEEQYRLSKSKCRATIVMLGSENVTIQYPCALVHLTIGYAIAGKQKDSGNMRIRLKPERVLVVYREGTQEFVIREDNLVPKGPFKPFQSFPSPHLSL